MIRPQMTEYQDPADYVRDMVAYRKRTEPHFSVLRETKNLRKVSPTLVSLIVRKKRKVTLDRTEELARLLSLSVSERVFFHDWIRRLEGGAEGAVTESLVRQEPQRSRREVSTHILSDWLNLYVKDCFQLSSVQTDHKRIYGLLAHIASQKRVDRCIQFLLKEGYLRRELDGRIVVETELTVTDPKVPSQKIRQFHRAALNIAREALETVPVQERLANTLVIPLDSQSYTELMGLISEFAGKLQDFAAKARDNEDGRRLYQLILNLSPTGGKTE